jgi:UDP-sugar transporter A1/2/3
MGQRGEEKKKTMPTRVAQSESTDDGRDEFEQSDELDYGESQPLMRAHTVGEGDAAAASSATICGMPKRTAQGLILVLLTLQNVVMYLVARHSQSGGKHASGKQYLKTTVVLMQELLKLACCFGLVVSEEGFNGMVALVRQEVLLKYGETLKVGVPALLYFFQNTLFYVGSANLDAAPFQAVSQFKVVTTAMVTVVLFRRCLRPLQWIAILALLVGLILVVLSNLKDTAAKVDTQPWLGYSATLGICVLSGLAGVYFEKVLKGSTVSIWVRNIQLSLMSIVVAVATTAVKDGARIAKDGFFQGYTTWTVASIVIIAAGGLVIAMVLKHASAVLKTFATGVAIVATGVVSSLIPAFHFAPNAMFIGGTFTVVAAIFLYGFGRGGGRSGGAGGGAKVVVEMGSR